MAGGVRGVDARDALARVDDVRRPGARAAAPSCARRPARGRCETSSGRAASSDEARIGSAAFFDPETRTSPAQARAAADDDLLQGRRVPAALRGSSALAGRGRGGSGGRGDAGVLVAQAALGARLPARFLAADLVAMMVAHAAAAPGHEVLAAVALGARGLLAALDAAGRTVVRQPPPSWRLRAPSPPALARLRPPWPAFQPPRTRACQPTSRRRRALRFFFSSFSAAIAALTICGHVGVSSGCRGRPRPTSPQAEPVAPDADTRTQ